MKSNLKSTEAARSSKYSVYKINVYVIDKEITLTCKLRNNLLRRLINCIGISNYLKIPI